MTPKVPYDVLRETAAVLLSYERNKKPSCARARHCTQHTSRSYLRDGEGTTRSCLSSQSTYACPMKGLLSLHRPISHKEMRGR